MRSLFSIITVAILLPIFSYSQSLPSRIIFNGQEAVAISFQQMDSVNVRLMRLQLRTEQLTKTQIELKIVSSKLDEINLENNHLSSQNTNLNQQIALYQRQVNNLTQETELLDFVNTNQAQQFPKTFLFGFSLGVVISAILVLVFG